MSCWWFFKLFFCYRSICLCHVCSEIRDIYKKTGAWFYKGLPNYEAPDRPTNGELKTVARGEPPKVIKTTKLGMEIESDEDEDDGFENTAGKEEHKSAKNGSFSSSFLKSRNLFNLRLSTDCGSRLTIDNISPLPKKSPVSPYSRQTSSSDSSQKSANSLQPQAAMDWESGSPSSLTLHRQRGNSMSSCYSISEGSPALESFTMNQSECVRQVIITFSFPILISQITVNQLFLAGLRYQFITMNHRTRCTARF